MLQKYVTVKCMTGLNEKDIDVDKYQLIGESGGFEVESVENVISESMFNALGSILDPAYSQIDIFNVLKKDGVYSFSVVLLDVEDASVLITVDSKHGEYIYDLRGSTISRCVYRVNVIDSANVGYLVMEQIFNPSSTCKYIERCYCECFKDFVSASNYRNRKMARYSAVQGGEGSGFKIFVVDRNQIEKSEWYRTNLMAMQYINDNGLDIDKYHYIPSAKALLEAVVADSYDDLPTEQQTKINYDLYMRVRGFLPERHRLAFDDNIEQMADVISDDYESLDLMESIADSAIAIALVNAPSEEVFMQIHKTLGAHEFRVGALTDSIYEANPGKGYIVISKNGDMGWYPECFAMNEWKGARGNPYFGKFQRNERDTLLCLREYHPELIAPSLPTRREIEEMEERYQACTATARRIHSEISFDFDEDGDELVIGNWYYDGIFSPNCAAQTMFYRKYGSHVFTMDECKALLSGEEIIIEHFITKMDIETTIRGMLKDCSDPADGYSDVQFVRTDIGSKSRLMLNAELGINEPGLPVQQ